MSRLFVKLDVDFWDHPKVIKAGESAAVLYLRMLAWSKKHLTDGYVPAEVVQTLCRVRAAEKQRKLHGAALIEQSSCSGGWQIVGWADDNRSRAEVEEIRSKRRSAGRRGAETRWQTDSNLPSVCHDDAMASCHDHEHTQSTEHIAHSSETPTSVVTESNRVLAGAASADEATVLWQAAGITRPEPTMGDRKSVAAAIRRGWTMAQLTERATTAAASNNPRGYLDAVLAAAPPTQARPPERRPLLDDERTPCDPCGASGWVDTKGGDVMACPACTVGARP